MISEKIKIQKYEKKLDKVQRMWGIPTLFVSFPFSIIIELFKTFGDLYGFDDV